MRFYTKRFERRYIPEFVYGGMDGSITTFAIISGVIGASLSSVIILILGFANLVASGFSIAISDYFSIKARNEITKKQEKHPAKSASATFLSFLLVGFIPLFPFVIASLAENPPLVENQFFYSIILTGLALAIVGWFKGEVTEKHKFKCIVETIIIGGMAALLAFVVGRFISILTI